MSLRYRPAGFLRMSWAAVALGVHAETQTWTGEGVPEPEPVAATITLGTYIFPGWYRAAGRGDYPYRTHTDLVPSAAKIVSFSMLTPEERAAAKALESQPHPVPPLAVRTTRVVADAPLPVRPPVLCAGCPHRGIYHALNKCNVVVTGDIDALTLWDYGLRALGS